MKYTLTRTNDKTGRVLTWEGLTIREIGQQVAFCATDNLGMDRATAVFHGMAAESAIRQGDGYQLAEYGFEVEE